MFSGVTVGYHQKLGIGMKIDVNLKVGTNSWYVIWETFSCWFWKCTRTSIVFSARIVTTSSFVPMKVPVAIWICTNTVSVWYSSFPPQSVLKKTIDILLTKRTHQCGVATNKKIYSHRFVKRKGLTLEAPKIDPGTAAAVTNLSQSIYYNDYWYNVRKL